MEESYYCERMADDVRSIRVPAELWTAAMQRAADNDEKVSDVVREALRDYTTHCESCDDAACDVCGSALLDIDGEFEETDDSKTATIVGHGRFSETENADVLALIDRARELLTEGAVGVSVALDADPADMPDPDEIHDDPEAAWDAMMDAHSRVRHVAIVDTPAFSGAHLSINDDGTLSGPIVFEGIPTGDGRGLPYENITLDEELMPIPIIFDITDGDHTGVTVGFIDRLERVEGIESTGEAPIAASVDAYPASLFAEPEPGPMHVYPPDEHGYRRFAGTLAPTNVCHKGRGGCYTYRGAQLDYFHSGAQIRLDNGELLRVGPLVMGGLHADDQQLDYAEALARTDDARRVFSFGRCYDHPSGLLYSGVLLPDSDIMRLQATAPSVELWPNSRGKLELKTALMVNRPALPVAASVGGGVLLADDTSVEVDEHEVAAELARRVEQLEQTVSELYAVHLSSALTVE